MKLFVWSGPGSPVSTSVLSALSKLGNGAACCTSLSVWMNKSQEPFGELHRYDCTWHSIIIIMKIPRCHQSTKIPPNMAFVQNGLPWMWQASKAGVIHGLFITLKRFSDGETRTYCELGLVLRSYQKNLQ